MNDAARLGYGLKKHRIYPMSPSEPAPTITTLPDDLLQHALRLGTQAVEALAHVRDTGREKYPHATDHQPSASSTNRSVAGSPNGTIRRR